MRRSGVIGALVLILTMVGGPAFAQVDPAAGGSALPNQPQSQQPLPPAGRSASSPMSTAAQVSPSPALADTGIQVSTGAALGFGLVVAGGGALLLTRRRATV